MIRIVIAEHREVLREGLRSLLAAQRDLEIAGDAGTAAALVELFPRVTASVCLLDAALPGGGFALLGRLHELRPTLRVVLLGAVGDAEMLRGVSLGVAGFLPLEVNADELVRAVRAVASGEGHLAGAMAGSLGSRLAGRTEGAAHERLSARELDVAVRLAAGDTLVEIGDELGISVRTVSTLRTRAMDKLGLTRNAELTRYAVEHDLLG